MSLPGVASDLLAAPANEGHDVLLSLR